MRNNYASRQVPVLLLVRFYKWMPLLLQEGSYGMYFRREDVLAVAPQLTVVSDERR